MPPPRRIATQPMSERRRHGRHPAVARAVAEDLAARDVHEDQLPGRGVPDRPLAQLPAAVGDDLGGQCLHVAIVPRRYAPRMRIASVETRIVGNAWKNWLFVRVETDDGLHGYGEGTVNGFAATVAAAIEELPDQYLGARPARRRGAPPADGPRRLHRRRPDPHGGRRPRSRSPAGTSSARRPGSRSTPCSAGGSATASAPTPTAGTGPSASPRPSPAKAREVAARRLHGDEVRPVRHRVARPGPPRRGPLDRHRAGGARRGRPRRRPDDRGAQPVHRLDRAADRRPSRRVPAGLAGGARPPLADGLDGRGRPPVAGPDRHRRELHLARPVRGPALARRRADPPARAAPPRRASGGRASWRRWPRRTSRSSRRTTPRVRSAARSRSSSGRASRTSTCRRPSTSSTPTGRRGSSTARSARSTATSRSRTRPGLGIELDWEALGEHPYRRQHLIRLFSPGWERRDDAPDGTA